MVIFCNLKYRRIACLSQSFTRHSPSDFLGHPDRAGIEIGDRLLDGRAGFLEVDLPGKRRRDQRLRHAIKDSAASSQSSSVGNQCQSDVALSPGPELAARSHQDAVLEKTLGDREIVVDADP